MMRRRQQWKDGGERGGFVGRAWYGAHGSARRAARYMSNKSRLVKDQADNAEKMEDYYQLRRIQTTRFEEPANKRPSRTIISASISPLRRNEGWTCSS